MSWRKTKEYRQWKVRVIRRDRTCVICDSHEHRHAHHIEDGSNHPEHRFDESNGVTLCKDCHMQFHCNYKHSYRQKCTMKDWMNFFSLCEYIKTI